MSTVDQEKRRKIEEARGPFVLGIIALLVILRIQNLPFIAEIVVNTLLVFWVAYAFLAVLGLSRDVFGQRISGTAYLLSLYALGCALLYCIGFVLLYVGTGAITAVVLLFYPVHCSIPAGVSSSVATFFCTLQAIYGELVVKFWVFLIALVFVLAVPPLIVAKLISKRYGKGIWPACAGTMMLIALYIVWIVANSLLG